MHSKFGERLGVVVMTLGWKSELVAGARFRESFGLESGVRGVLCV